MLGKIYIDIDNVTFNDIILQTKQVNEEFLSNPTSEFDEDFIIAFAYNIINAKKAGKSHLKNINVLTRNDYILELQNTKEYFNRVMNRIINGKVKLLDALNQEENCLDNKTKEELIAIIKSMNPAAK